MAKKTTPDAGSVRRDAPARDARRKKEYTAEQQRRRSRRARDLWITAGVFLLAGLAVFLLLRFSMSVDSIVLYEPVYKYQVTERIDYSGVTELRHDDGVTTLKNGETVLQLGAEPLYYRDRNALLLPTDMILVLPDRPLLARMERFSVVTYAENGIALSRGDKSQMIARGFLYDGVDRYVFLTGIRLTWLDQELTLSPLSLVTVTADETLICIDHQSGEAIRLDTGACTVLAQSESGYEVNLTSNSITLADGTNALLFTRADILDPIL